MDKQKTGILIKEARTEKDFTQSELGDLVGVTNKAVSRWENGESFPDIGVVERLSEVLGLKIQDIVTGEKQSDDEEALKDAVRIAILQKNAEKRKLMRKSGVTALRIISLIICVLSWNVRTDKYCIPVFWTMTAALVLNTVCEIISSEGERKYISAAGKISLGLTAAQLILMCVFVFKDWTGYPFDRVAETTENVFFVFFCTGILLYTADLICEIKEFRTGALNKLLIVFSIFLPVWYFNIVGFLQTRSEFYSRFGTSVSAAVSVLIISVLITGIFLKKIRG